MLCFLFVGCKSAVPSEPRIIQTEDPFMRTNDGIGDNADILEDNTTIKIIEGMGNEINNIDDEQTQNNEPTLEQPKDEEILEKNIIHTVRLMNTRFDPESLSIHSGDSVVFLNVAGRGYILRDNKGLWKAQLVSGQNFSYTYNTSGIYPYRDITVGLRAEVVVT